MQNKDNKIGIIGNPDGDGIAAKLKAADIEIVQPPTSNYIGDPNAKSDNPVQAMINRMNMQRHGGGPLPKVSGAFGNKAKHNGVSGWKTARARKTAKSLKDNKILH